MGRGRTHGVLLEGACASALYVLALLVAPASLRGLTTVAALALTAAAGWRGGPRVGALAGALLAGLHLALAPRIAAPYETEVTFALGQLALVLAGYGIGCVRRRLADQLGAHEHLEARYALAAAATEDGLWDWDVRTGEVFRSVPFRELTGTPDERAGSPSELLAAVHPEDLGSARAALEAHLEGETTRYEHAHRVRRPDGSWRWVRERAQATRDVRGRPRRVVGLLTDISEHKENEAWLRHHAFHDALTGLPNRALFMDRVQHAVARTRRAPTSSFAVMMLDLDRFKSINDSFGHAAGDQLLMRVAERMRACVREGDTVARLGGDEFSMLLEGLREEQDAERVAEHVQRTLATPVPLDGHDVVTSASIGIVIARDDAFDALSLLRRADQAMYAAKKQGRGRHAVFEATAHASSSVRQELEDSLSSAIDEKQLRVYFQPIIHVATGEVCAFEALVRWPHPTLGLVSPAELVPVAEASDAIVRLSDFVLDEACRAVRRLQTTFAPKTPFRMAVNLSSRELARDDLVERVERTLRRTEVPPASLVLDVKESSLIEDGESAQQAFRALRARGVRVHMDDFGTGYSSLSYLHRVPVDALKIDGMLTGRLHDNLGAEEVVRSVITIARDLRLGVVAEGVENREQLRRLRALGCEEAQGFLFGAALPLEAVEAMLKRGRKLALA